MKNTPRVLTAVDSSRSATAAFEHALAIAVRLGAELVIVHAVSRNWPYSWGAAERVAALSALRARADALNVPVRVRVQQGDAAKIILLHAKAHAPDLIVLGSHEPVGLDRLRFGSVADRVVKGATAPVLLTPASAGRAAPTVRRIVFATDLSAGSEAALSKAARIAGRLDARLVVLHVLHDPVPLHRAHFAVPEFRRLMMRDARQRLQAVLRAQDLHADPLVRLSATTIHDGILRAGDDVKADLIVMGPTRRTGLRRRILGSTALEVSRRARRSVLILPAAGANRRLSSRDQVALGWAA